MLTRKLVARAKKKEGERKRGRREESVRGIRGRDFMSAEKREGGGEERSREQDIVAHRACGSDECIVRPAGNYARGISTRTRAADQSIREIYGTDDGART